MKYSDMMEMTSLQDVSFFYSTGRELRSQDELYDLTLKSKDEEESGKVYIRRLQVAPSPECVLASDRQVQDVERFCANTTNQFSILPIDTTFNIQATSI